LTEAWVHFRPSAHPAALHLKEASSMQASSPSFYAVLNRLDEGVVLTDPEGQVTFANPSADRMLGVRRTDPMPQGWSEYYRILRPDGETPFPREELPISRGLKGEATADVEMVIANPNLPGGSLISVDGQPLEDDSGKLVGVAFVIRERRSGAAPAQSRAKKVLVIDDNQAVRRTICAIIRAGGYEAVEAVDGRDGIEELAHYRFDLVITDVMMPRQDGIETIQRIRELDAKLPIVAISGSGTEEFSPLQDAQLMGADRIIGKPFHVEEILGVVRELLHSKTN
jgi:CheY-like chemotaxis protein